MRGKSVTREQAFDIIRRTDKFFSSYIDEICEHDDFIGGLNFDNWLIMKNHGSAGYGWIHVDGSVGVNAITQKYPTVFEYIAEWLEKAVAFPYLNLAIAVTYWDEVPPHVCDDWEYQEMLRERKFECAEYDEEFYKAIEMGIYVHDKTVEIMDSTRTRTIYKEYVKRYEDSNRDKYRANYYEDNKIVQVNESYLKKCIESYGLDAEKVLEKVPEYA